MLSVGEQIGRYKVHSALGAGGMGEVFLAEDTELERLIALKVLPTDLATDTERVRRFVQEAKAASALNHPNILTIYEIGSFNGTRFIASEYIKGKTLRDKIKSDSFDLRQTLEIAIQIASALETAHQAKIIHRDIKPENIMIRDDGLVKVLDFGLAKLTENKEANLDTEAETRALVKTTPGVVMGTVGYMSPEQARGKETDQRTDIFSLGVVIYEMLTSRQPFAGETMSDRIAAILMRDPAAPSSINPKIPTELDEIVLKTLCKDCNDRYQSAQDLLTDLKEFKHELDFLTKLERHSQPNKNAEPQIQIIKTDTTAENEQRTAILYPAATDEKETPLAATENVKQTLQDKTKAKRKWWLFGLLGVILLISALFAYRYFLPSSKQIESIAVLPFENVSGNADLDYLSDGVSESVIDRLSQLSQLKVIARSSSFKYRGHNLNLPEIANALGVQAVVTGRVVPRGDSYQIRVELVDVRDNKQLWGENFNRKASDVQILQADISREIAENLSLRLSGTQSQQFAKEGTTNPQAYEALVKGRFFFNKPGQDNRNKATEHFEQAVAADPKYALAWAYLANAYTSGGKDLDRKERHAKRRMAAEKAVELAPNLADAHYALGQVKFNDWEWAEAEREFKLSIELNPNLAKAYSGLQSYLIVMGRLDEAIAAAKRSVELDPVDYVAATRLSIAFHRARRYDETIETAKRVIEIEPNFFFAHLALADAYAAKGMYKEAIAEYQESLRLNSNNGAVIEANIGATYVKMGDRAKAEEILKSIESRANDFSSTPIDLSLLYDALGMRDEAFVVLEQAFAEHAGDLGYMRTNPKFDNMRSDPRFLDLLRRMNLPQ